MLNGRAMRRAKQLASAGMDAAGVLDRRLRRAADEGIWLIPTYHRIILDPREDPLRMGMCVSVETFERQLRYLASDFDLLTLEEAVGRLEQGRRLPKRAASITFDDGYLDNLKVAAPLLKQRGLRATLFVATGALGSPSGFWWDRVINSLLNGIGSGLDYSEVGCDGGRVILSSGNVPSVTRRVLAQLWRRPIEEVAQVVSLLSVRFGVEREYGPGVMSQTQLKEAEQLAFDLGVHTVRHPNLCLMSRSEVEEEVEQGTRDLEHLSGHRHMGFAAPGGYTPAFLAEQLVRQGFKYAVTTERGLNREIDLLRLQRIGMPETTLSDLKRSLAFC
jgi:peptidoglycan/xylan/chitin deacetylase (PgdA/CDA1 family)